MIVSLFIPCLSQHLFPGAAMSMVKILHHLGVDIDYVEDQTCCGQPAFNSGYRQLTIPMAERLIRLFQDKEAVIAPSGSCTAMVRVFYKELDIDHSLRSPLASLSKRIFEFTEFLVNELKVTDLGGEFSHRVTYHDSCHLSRELGIREQPRQLIRAIRKIDFVEMPHADACCGFGGTFSYKMADISLAMVQRKCENILASGAEYCIGADSSCLMNIDGYLSRHRLQAKTMHIADLLATSLNL